MVSWKKMFISLIYKVRDDENGCSSPSEADEQSSSTRLLEFWPRPVINTQCSPSTLLDYWRGGTTTSTTSLLRSSSPGWHQLQILQVKDAEWFLTWRNVFLTLTIQQHPNINSPTQIFRGFSRWLSCVHVLFHLQQRMQ